MSLSQKLMRFELPFKIRMVDEVASGGVLYKLFTFKDSLLSEFVSRNNVVKVVPVTSSDVPRLPHCMFQGWSFRGPNALYSIEPSGRKTILRLCWRNSCDLCEIIKDIKITNIYDQNDSLVLVYKKNKEYHAIIDDLSGFTITRLSESKPKQMLYKNGVLVLFFSDYTRVVTPTTGVIDMALTENIEPLGVSLVDNLGNVLLYSKSSGIVFALSRTRNLEPLATCNEAISIRNVRGEALVLCDFEPLNSSFYPFYAGKIFVDIFKETEYFNIIDPYILSFIKKNNRRYFVVAQISSHPVYINIAKGNVTRRSVIAPIDLRGLEEQLLESIENLYGPLIDDYDKSDKELVASIHEKSSDDICFGTSCGKCIVRVSSLSSLDSRDFVLSTNGRSYKASYVYDKDVVFVISDKGLCSLLKKSSKITLCDKNKNRCITVPIIHSRNVNADLTCGPGVAADVDKIRVMCRPVGDVNKVIEYSSCTLVRANNELRLYVRENGSCLVGLVTPDGYVVKKELTYGELGRGFIKRISRLVSVSVEETYRDSLIIKFSYESNGLILFKINGLFSVVEAPYIILRLSGNNELLIRDNLGIRRVNLILPHAGKILLENTSSNKSGLFRIRCLNAYCTLFCGNSIITGESIYIGPDHMGEKACHLVLMGRGTSKIIRINPVIEALRLGVLTGRKLAQLLQLS